MCLLVVCSPGSTPKKADLMQGACSNPHGYGFALVAGDQIITYRSMSAKKTINKFLALRSENPDGYAIWHARYATHGVKNEYNCHPLKVGGDELSYLAHNGVLATHIESYDKRSDTRILAEDTLPKIGGVPALDDPNIWIMLSSWASGSKIAVLTLNPLANHQLYLINEHLGDWDSDDIWWSNSSYKKVTPPSRIGYSSVWTRASDYTLPEVQNDPVWGDTLIDQCVNCLGLTSYMEDFCDLCHLCFDCNATRTECLCYKPTRLDREYDRYLY